MHIRLLTSEIHRLPCALCTNTATVRISDSTGCERCETYSENLCPACAKNFARILLDATCEGAC